jgi:hypothetical protein
VTNPEPTTEKEKVNPEINLKYYEVTIDKVVEDILKDFESSGVN